MIDCFLLFYGVCPKIFATSMSFGLKRFTCNWSLVNADPMQYLLNPCGNTRNWRSISSTGE